MIRYDAMRNDVWWIYVAAAVVVTYGYHHTSSSRDTQMTTATYTNHAMAAAPRHRESPTQGKAIPFYKRQHGLRGVGIRLRVFVYSIFIAIGGVDRPAALLACNATPCHHTTNQEPRLLLPSSSSLGCCGGEPRKARGVVVFWRAFSHRDMQSRRAVCGDAQVDECVTRRARRRSRIGWVCALAHGIPQSTIAETR